MDVINGKIADLKRWQGKAELEAALMYSGRYVVHSILSSDNKDRIVPSSTDRLHNIAGTYVGKDDPIAIIRTQNSFLQPKRLAVHLLIPLMYQEPPEEVIICRLCQ